MTGKSHAAREPAPVAEAASQTGAQAVVRSLEAMGVSHVFGVPGAKIDGVFDALVDSPIRTVACRHEQNAAFIAAAIGRMTGRAGVAIATSGPGSSNLVTGLATATSEGDPVVALGGSVNTADALKQVHQALNAVDICRAVTKFSATVSSPASVTEVMANAFRAAESGRPGAAFVSLPWDVMAAPCAGTVIGRPKVGGPGPADRAGTEAAARLIKQAANPVVLLGLLASRPDAADAIRRFVNDTGLPVVATFQAAGALGSQQFESFGGRVGQIANQPADRLLASADLLVTIGYDPVEYPPADWNGHMRRAIVHVDVGAAAMDECYQPEIELTGDLSQTLDALAPLVGARPKHARSGEILRHIREERAELARMAAQMGGTPVHPLRLVHELQDFLADDVTLCVDIGSFYLWIARHLYSFRARQVLISNGQQTLGVALPWAIAASIVRPADKILSISGDGGFLYSAMELETAVRLKANIVHLVWIDGGYNMVEVQQMMKYGRSNAVKLGPVDVVKYAEAFGASGRMINHPDEIAAALAWGFDTPGPVILGVPVDYRDNHRLFESVSEHTIR